MKTALDVLASSIESMANQQSNPVLEVIPASAPIIEDKKYPESGLLTFHDSAWRAYYHCHPPVRKPQQRKHRFEGEHGHFHLFTQLAGNTWSHLAALAMDNMGQPLGWFTVNQWVTGEQWGKREELIKRLQAIELQENGSVLESWIMAFISLSTETIIELLKQRDELIAGYDANEKIIEKEEIKQNRGIYLLSEVRYQYQHIMDRYS